MKNTLFMVLLLLSFMAPLATMADPPASFTEIYSALRQKASLPDKSLDELEKMGKQESVSLENRLVSQVLAVAVLSSKDVDSLTKRSITICDRVIQEYPDTWEADYLRFARLMNYGLLANYKKQITLANAALTEINFNRIDTEQQDFLKICREDLGLSGRKMKNQILSTLGYAYRNTGSFDEAKEAYLQIDDVAERNKQLKQVDIFRDKYMQNQRSLQGKTAVTNKATGKLDQ